MRVHLQYGTTGLDVELPAANVQVIAPRFVPGLPDEHAAFLEAVRSPMDAAPLASLVHAHERVAIVIPDITRPLPTDRLLPWVLHELRHVPDDHITIVNGTGSHRVNSPDELRAMVGPDIHHRCRIVNHDSHDPATLVRAGIGYDGQPVSFNRTYAEADRRIVLGFIEPHFMAGFSGGYKGIFPAVADIDAIMRYHDARMIGDARSTRGIIGGNPTQARIRHDGALVPLDFCINVTLNRQRAITAFFCGAPLAAHDAGCKVSRDIAMVPCEHAFPIVVTTNSGYPLDQNLYQAVKGMSAAAQIVEDGGTIVAAARCNDGFPAHGNFRTLLFEYETPAALLAAIHAPGFLIYDQWEAQMLALIQAKAAVGLYSELPDDEVRRAHLVPVHDVADAVAEGLATFGKDAPVAVLPEGPMTIPYLAG